jgi:RNA polymerase sigma-70 factor (ECF subfamily)
VRRLVSDALARLPDDAREICVLRDLEGLSYEEIAEALEIPVGTVRSRLSRARAQLRDLLAPHFPEGA